MGSPGRLPLTVGLHSFTHFANERTAVRARRECGGVGVLRLRSCFASRSGYFAQDDIILVILGLSVLLAGQP
jgi:hypothetical protein